MKQNYDVARLLKHCCLGVVQINCIFRGTLRQTAASAFGFDSGASSIGSRALSLVLAHLSSDLGSRETGNTFEI